MVKFHINVCYEMKSAVVNLFVCFQASSHTPASDSQKKNAVPQIKLTEEQRQQLMEAFHLFDKGTTGEIDVWAIKVISWFSVPWIRC